MLIAPRSPPGWFDWPATGQPSGTEKRLVLGPADGRGACDVREHTVGKALGSGVSSGTRDERLPDGSEVPASESDRRAGDGLPDRFPARLFNFAVALLNTCCTIARHLWRSDTWIVPHGCPDITRSGGQTGRALPLSCQSLAGGWEICYEPGLSKLPPSFWPYLPAIVAEPPSPRLLTARPCFLVCSTD